MAIGNLLRKAADMTDTAVSKASEAYGDVKERVRGEDAGVAYEQGISALATELSKTVPTDFDMGIIVDAIQAAKKANPYA